jgi:pimeloyl-ACP methyl ester carboxylesterase
VESPVTIRPISFPRVGSGSTAYAWTFTVSGIPVGDDLILFRAGSYEGHLTYADVGSPSITALGLHRPGVLGWSMGSMIAQALAVLHPDQVNRLVLGAGYPGNETAARPPQQAINALNTGGQRALAVLFPAGQAGAQNAYLAATSSYPATPAVLGQEAVAARGHAIDAWWAGQDPRVSHLRLLANPAAGDHNRGERQQ